MSGAGVGAGCGRQPQVAADNREIVVSLVTAVSAHNPDWLESNAQLIEKRRSEGKLSDAEYEKFSAIVAQAKAGDWKAAENAAYALREAQEPTAEDLQNLAARSWRTRARRSPGRRVRHENDHQTTPLTPSAGGAAT